MIKMDNMKKRNIINKFNNDDENYIYEYEKSSKRMDSNNESQRSGNFKVLYLITQLIGITLVVLMITWIFIHMGGVGGTSNPKLEFNWHPILMTIGLIFLYGNAILIYRGFSQTRKKTLKLTHALIHFGSMIFTIFGLIAVFDSHNLTVPPIPNLYSLHSWLGITAVVLYFSQWLIGLIAFLLPGLKMNIRAALMPYHIYFGLLIFVMALATALMGLTEKALFAIKDYSSLPNNGLIVNVLGVLIVVFGGFVLYLTTESSYKRKPLPEDAMLLTNQN